MQARDAAVLTPAISVGSLSVAPALVHHNGPGCWLWPIRSPGEIWATSTRHSINSPAIPRNTLMTSLMLHWAITRLLLSLVTPLHQAGMLSQVWDHPMSQI